MFQDLAIFIDDQKFKGYEVILMMDASESDKVKNSKVTKFLARISLNDLYKTTMFDLLIKTILGSRIRINFIFATEGIFEIV